MYGCMYVCMCVCVCVCVCMCVYSAIQLKFHWTINKLASDWLVKSNNNNTNNINNNNNNNNNNNKPSFTITPSHGHFAPHQSLSFSVTFRPTHTHVHRTKAMLIIEDVPLVLRDSHIITNEKTKEKRVHRTESVCHIELMLQGRGVCVCVCVCVYMCMCVCVCVLVQHHISNSCVLM